MRCSRSRASRPGARTRPAHYSDARRGREGPCVEITVSSRHTEVSDALRASTIEKIGRLSRFLEGMDRAEVHFSEHRNKRNADKEVCEVTLEGHGHHVRCKVSAPDGFAAVDPAVEKLEHQLHKLKTKLLKVKRNDGHRKGTDRTRGIASDELL